VRTWNSARTNLKYLGVGDIIALNTARVMEASNYELKEFVLGRPEGSFIDD